MSALSPASSIIATPIVGQAFPTRGPGAAPNTTAFLALNEEEQRIVRELRTRDREVRAHEQAHMAAGGPYVSGPYYEYQKGPDGQRYAVGGSVTIDASPVPGDPEATIAKMEIVIRAALAPAEPSPQDLKVAAAARKQKLAAQSDAAEQPDTAQQPSMLPRQRGSMLNILV